MWLMLSVIWTLGLVFFVPMVALAQHNGLTTYNGSASCMSCHPGKAEEVHASAHYQLKGPTPAVPNLKGKIAGKMGQINDFCTYPDINWLFEMTNLANAKVVVGCGSCHVGMGAKPTPTATPEQLANIDCLMCHSEVYKRVGAMVGGQPTFVTDPTVDINAALAAIQLPSKATCLTRCHVGAGGGAGIKQGDIDPAQLDPPRTLDVHMSSQGAGLSCLSCHKAQNHRIAGRGNDIRETDLNLKVDCLDCHSLTPHASQDINKHTARVNCTVCHIPAFARGAATDVMRDFTGTERDPATNRYEPIRTLATNVTPTYKWFNGLSYFYEFDKPIIFRPAGSFTLSAPLGSILDSGAKIHAFKLHKAKLGYALGSRRQIPVKSKVLWETGNIDQALRQGAAEVGWPLYGYAFANSSRYLSLHHEVPSKESALQCADCHVSTGRMNFTELGYVVKTTRNDQPLCSSCHGREPGEFYSIHSRHVDRENLSCTTCHKFTAQPPPPSVPNITPAMQLLLSD
jgi:hypothetical protein